MSDQNLQNMLNVKRRSRIRNHLRCYCDNCNGTYVDTRTKNKYSINRNIVNTPISLQSNDPIIETSQHSSLQYEDSSENLNTIEQHIDLCWVG
jgi:hypothetical protein